MTVGEVIALICKQASDEDVYLMRKGIYSIDVNDDEIELYFTDGNTENYSIKAESKDCISRQAAIDKMQELEDEDIKAYGCSIPEGFDGQRAIRALKTL